jgi:hypothetical protein
MQSSELLTSDWQIEGLRLTAFVPHAPAGADAEAWWAEIVGRPAERMSRAGGRYEVGGPLDLHQHQQLPPAALVIRLEPGRIDWVVGPTATQEPTLLSMHLGAFPGPLDRFRAMMSPWLQTVSLEVERLALGATLRRVVDNPQEGNRFLSRNYLPFEIQPDISDFQYRSNRPTTSGALSDGTRINLLSTWSVVQLQTVVLAIRESNTHVESLSNEGDSFTACRLELDINTQPNRVGLLPNAHLKGLLAEFSELASSVVAGERR